MDGQPILFEDRLAVVGKGILNSNGDEALSDDFFPKKLRKYRVKR
jgi:hypothetical protein